MADTRGQSDSESESITGGSTSSISSSWRKKTASEPAYNHIYDIVCIGFQSKSISLAIALQERSHNARVLFLERQPRSTYVPFTRLPGTFMQLSFLNDLVTLENPRSKFSFINYLHSTGQLVQFTNLGCIQPLREHFARYLGWCVDQLDMNVRYGSEASSVRPVRFQGDLVNAWSIEYFNIETGEIDKVVAKQVVCAGEPRARVPTLLSSPDISSSVLHASNCLDLLSTLSQDLNSQYHVAVIGDGQEAAEIVESLCNMRSAHQVIWVRTTSTKRAEDIDQTLSHRLYERQYSQRIYEPDPKKSALQVHSNTEVESACRTLNGRVRLTCTSTNISLRNPDVFCDFVIAATGYKELDYRQLLQPVQGLLYGDSLTVSRSGSVNLKPNLMEQDCGIWMLPSNKPGDKSLEQMAATSRYLLESLMKKRQESSARVSHIQSRL